MTQNIMKYITFGNIMCDLLGFIMFNIPTIIYFIIFLVVDYITNEVVQHPLLPTSLTPHSYLS